MIFPPVEVVVPPDGVLLLLELMAVEEEAGTWVKDEGVEGVLCADGLCVDGCCCG
jgi:hypothetical protein